MLYGVTLLLRDTENIRNIWEALAGKGVSRDQVDFGCSPHVTLAGYDMDDPRALAQDMKKLLENSGPIPVSFSEITILFKQTCCALVARPERVNDLFSRQALVFAARKSTRPIDHIDKWQGHVTLARQIPQENVAAAVTIATEHFRPFKTELNAMAIMSVSDSVPTTGKTLLIAHL